MKNLIWDPEHFSQATERNLAFLTKETTHSSPELTQLTRSVSSLLSRVSESQDFVEGLRQIEEAAPWQNQEIHLTGYFEIALKGSRTPSERYSHPIYNLPPHELQKLTRHEIDAKQQLTGKGLELAWVDDPIQLYFLHVQGSGVVQLEDGASIAISAVATNEREYVSLGGLLVQRGVIEKGKLSMPTIVSYLQAHQNEMQELFLKNPRYVFFGERSGDPVGSTGVELTPFQSIAADPKHYPLGSLCLLSYHEPRASENSSRQVSRLVYVQDTGGAIIGPERVDLFCGAGTEAQYIAGHLNTTALLAAPRYTQSD